MQTNVCLDPLIPYAAEVIAMTQETPTIYTLHLRFCDPAHHDCFQYYPGQFNMIYLDGVGEIAISIVSDPEMKGTISHTIRALGRVTKALQKINVGDSVGIRGPFGRGWPLVEAKNKNIIAISGGLGCAPTVSIINYILARRDDYRDLKILQGIKHSDDFIFRKQYEKWALSPNTEIHIAADQAGPKWPWAVGYVTDMINTLSIQPDETIVMMCGPEMMMRTAVQALSARGVADNHIYLSMERNMACGIGLCGHCQVGSLFVCKDGPVFSYDRIKSLFMVPGF